MAKLNVDYGQIVNRAWLLTKNNKWLWVYGLVLALFSGSSGYSNIGRLGNLGSKSISPTPTPSRFRLPETLDTSQRVLGAATDAFVNWVAHVSPVTWVFLGLGILIFIVFAIVISLIVRNWAKGSLIAALDLAESGQPVTLPPTAAIGLSKTKPLILLGLLNFFVPLALIITLILVCLILSLLTGVSPILGSIVLVLYLLVAAVGFILAVIILTLTAAYADRLVVLHNYSPLQAWKKAFWLSKHSFLSGLVMGLINTGLGCAVGCLTGLVTLVLLLIFGLPVFLAFVGAFAGGQFHPIILTFAIVLSLLLLIAVQLSQLITGIFIVFRHGTWNLFFKQVISQLDHD